MSDVQQNNNVQIVVHKSTKSVGISLLLTFFFGGLGMLYSTIIGAIIMIIIEIIALIFTAGIGLLITQPICMIWGAIAAKKHNDNLLQTN